jgi:hypothetical protein
MARKAKAKSVGPAASVAGADVATGVPSEGTATETATTGTPQGQGLVDAAVGATADGQADLPAAGDVGQQGEGASDVEASDVGADAGSDVGLQASDEASGETSVAAEIEWPVRSVIRNHGSIPFVDPVSGKYLGAGQSDDILLPDEAYAGRVQDNIDHHNSMVRATAVAIDAFIEHHPKG